MTTSETPSPDSANPAEDFFAKVKGEPWNELPDDLYIPPDALEVFLDAFEGPLDLLLWLIKKQNLDILDIPITRITEQYMEYVMIMKDIRLDLAAEYLVMAATLAEIKSRMLLPRRVHAEEDENDPRAELMRRLQEYERYKKAAEELDEMPRFERDLFPAKAVVATAKQIRPPPELELRELLFALKDVLQRADMFSSHQIAMEPLSVRERMSLVLEKLSAEHFTPFTELFPANEGKTGVIVTFLALLELLKDSLIEIVQAELFATIHVKASSKVTKPHALPS